ncbi:HNH endonuclease [Roseibium sp. SCPC15]|uniref:HNH endonuclease n=1 Tax=Roseibium sp. SCP15 TaxID=3141376 RepID=UPI003335E7D1
MANAIFYYKPNSPYDDIKGVKHHFPKRYLRTVEQSIGDWVVYYGPVIGMPSRYYTMVAKPTHITPDTEKEGHYYTYLEESVDFDHPLEYSEHGGYETGLFKADGKPNGGRVINAIRPLSDEDFRSIINAGLSAQDEWPARTDNPDEASSSDGFGELHQTPLAGPYGERPIISQLVNRPFRDAKFRHHIRKLYDRTCAFTGLRLINGKGRPEVEAAHIIPVENGGNDSIQNGIALSGTVHWMFDRGLLSLSDDFDILPSRHLNYDVSHMLHADMKARVPEDPAHQPHPHYLDWHRTNKFKK